VNNTTIHTHVLGTKVRTAPTGGQIAPIIEPDKKRLLRIPKMPAFTKSAAKKKVKPPVQTAPESVPIKTSVIFSNITPQRSERGDYTTRLGHSSGVVIPARTANQNAVSATLVKRAAATASDKYKSDMRPLSFGERMLRNTAVCVAILLCVLAVKTIDTPITSAVSAELREWVTMDIDESLGSLKFVQNILPDAALVFWHIGSADTYLEPSQLTLSHSWNESEPYLTYAGDKQQQVLASQSGEVMSVVPSSDGTSTVRIRHADGLESVYQNMASCTVREGDSVTEKQVIGAASTLYFEIRGEGRSMNPVPLMAEKP
jgi:stage II sporulation protein Q